MPPPERRANADSPYKQCRMCPRDCRVDRTSGQTGICGETSTCRVASATAHFGEEPALSGTRGSGTIFFSGCSCRCFFCQNHQISFEHAGRPRTGSELLGIARDVVRRGVHNLNFVTPDHFWPHVRELCSELRREGITIPFVYNCSGYERPDMIEEIADVIDIFLPDCKFSQPDLAEACMGDRRYPEIALEAITRMVRACGFLSPWDPAGRHTAGSGVMVRHLVLPGHVQNSLDVLTSLHDRFGPDVPLSVMSQFRPTPRCQQHAQLVRPVTHQEYERVCCHVEQLGFEQVFIQPGAGDESFMPDFSEDEPFRGNTGLEDAD